MNTQKVAITMPKDLVAAVDAISRERGISRSKFVSLTIEEKIANERDKNLREAYDRVFADVSIRKEQLDTANWFQQAGSNEGQEW
jgi:metal-responsive CopG/Arc/MetJ family transcriptional regulator